MKGEDKNEIIARKLKIAQSEGLPTKVFFFIPNIVGYIRILCLVIAFFHCTSNYRVFVVFYVASYILDQVDGMAARHFKQCKNDL